jgi:8-oxo-dGTP diphosphatase
VYTLRLMSVAVLFHGDHMLMMKRSPNRTLSPGKWAGIGGHLEPAEIGDPYAACLREVEEETGLRPEDIEGLELRYILLRLNGRDLRQQFVYVGRALKREVTPTDEGELHWIHMNDVLNRDIPYVFRTVLQHWLQGDGPSEPLWMATATLEAAPKPDGSDKADAIAPEDTNAAMMPAFSFVPIRDPGLV